MFVNFSGLGNSGSHGRLLQEIRQEKKVSISHFEGGLSTVNNDDDDDDDDD